jgi:pyrimidine operon attenuation protein / uracil phosphoribosyltransferase
MFAHLRPCFFGFKRSQKMTVTKNYILDQSAIAAKIERLAYEIAEQNMNAPAIILAGIAPNGVIMARHLALHLQKMGTATIQLVTLTLDKKQPSAVTVSPVTDFNQQTVIVVDDVSMSGKTMLYALKPMLETWPAKIQTLVLVERQHKQFPMHSDYVGMYVSTSLQELILVEAEGDELVGAYLE